MRIKTLIVCLILSSSALAAAQGDPQDIQPILNEQLQSPQVVTFQLQQFLLRRTSKLPIPQSASQWTAEAQPIRQHLLTDVIFGGWPQDWVNSPPKFEDLGPVPAGKGYQLHKLRYEIVPGFYATALLYEPEHLSGKVPAVLNLMGHYYPQGNTAEFEQKLCINEALRGMIALSLDWLGTGDLYVKGNEHHFAADLDLVGMNGAGLFYLAMRRGLDYLAEYPDVDSNRIGVTGLSGGGWQTIVLSSLDPRVLVSIPVAGFTSLSGRVDRVTTGETGDIEQVPTDFLEGQDYSTLTALRAPRPTLLIFNAEDSCCFRAPLVKPEVYDPIKPFFSLYGHEDDFRFHQNTNISIHNYGEDNREQAYQFFAKHFHLQEDGSEIPVGQDIKSYDELRVDLPENNLTILQLSRQIAAQIRRKSPPADIAERSKWVISQRTMLKDVVRYHAVSVSHASLVANTYHNQVESTSYTFELNNDLWATGVWLKEFATKPNAPITIILNDGGKAATDILDRTSEVADRMERGEQVLVLDLLFTGDDTPGRRADSFAEMLAATGERPLGMEAAQLIGLARWAQTNFGSGTIRVESTGIRSELISLVAAALDPNKFSEVAIYGGMHSLGYLLEKPVPYEAAPDLFCLDLYKDFDIDQLKALADPTPVIERDDVDLHRTQ